MLPLKVNRQKLLKLDCEVEALYAQICRQMQQLLDTAKGNHSAEELLTKIQPKLHRAALELHENPQISAHHYIHDQFTLKISKDAKDPSTVHLSLTTH